MRIALFHNLLSGGAKRTLFEATRRLATRHHVDAFSLSSSEHDFADIRPFVANHQTFPFDALPLLKFPLGRLNQIARLADLGRLNRTSVQVARVIEEGGYDVVLVHPCRYEQAPSILRQLRHTPSVYYCHEPLRLLYETMPARPYDDAAVGRRRLLNRLDPLPAVYLAKLRKVDRANTRSASRVLVNSTFTAAAVARAYGVEAHVSYHAVDVEQFRPIATTKHQMVLSVGSLTPLKGFDFLVRAMAEYPRANRPTLRIASNFQNPPERAYLTQLAAGLGVELVLSGNVGDQDLVNLYNQAKVVVYAPVREPFGLVPLEAMACATPVVAVAEGGISETVLDGRTGFLTSRDPKSFAAAVRHLVERPALSKEYGENGRAHVLREWTWDRSVATLEQHLKASTSAEPGARSSVAALAR